ncbi:MAG TPA: hypothetical protein VHC90_24495 [Bryobacteraceae bacterium]|nr:hypothetical protein [Bryobacteraceae bacterium]
MRRIYSVLIHLHPRAFREQFGPEMMAIFDEMTGSQLTLLGDAVASLVRQWVFRPPSPNASVPAPVSGSPAFASLEPYRIRPGALLHGGFATAALFAAVIFLIDHPEKTARFLVGMERAAESILPISRSSLEAQDLNTTVQVPEPGADLWKKLAIAYYKFLPVIKALDIDGDYTISSRELILAPASLRSLDRNQDGKLDGRECGSAGEPTAFVRRNPVLAVVDADGNGELSASEIQNAAEALRTLDRNGDGQLTPDEYLPRP